MYVLYQGRSLQDTSGSERLTRSSSRRVRVSHALARGGVNTAYDSARFSLISFYTTLVHGIAASRIGKTSDGVSEDQQFVVRYNYEFQVRSLTAGEMSTAFLNVMTSYSEDEEQQTLMSPRNRFQCRWSHQISTRSEQPTSGDESTTWNKVKYTLEALWLQRAVGITASRDGSVEPQRSEALSYQILYRGQRSDEHVMGSQSKGGHDGQ